MKKLMLKISVFWLLYGLIAILLIYLLQGLSLRMIPLDIRYAFIGNRKTLYAVVVCLAVMALFCCYAVMNAKKILRFRWDVRIGVKGFCLQFGNLKSFYANLNRILAAGICFVVLILAGSALLPSAFGKEQRTGEAPWTSYPVAHAMGEIDGYSYTNSLDAFEYNYGLGHRVFEVDFSMTADDKMVCWHDWGLDYLEGVDNEHVPTEEAFQSMQILGKYQPLTLKDLLLLMEEYEDIYIITDTKSNDRQVITKQFAMIVDMAKELGVEEILDRFIIQIYFEGMYGRVKEAYDFPDIIFTMYISGWDRTAKGFFRYSKFCREQQIHYVTMDYSLATPEILEIARAYDITVFAHTVNDLEEAETLIENGVKGVYTDTLTPEMFLGEE
ncbi:MAG: hypothetical protein NC419_04905 [Muribaculaceae bacterium]|nr:hypothetical protein [Muribaculaceae bacterium]